MQSSQRRLGWHLLPVCFPTFVLCSRCASGTAECGTFPMWKACIVGSLQGYSSAFTYAEIHKQKSTWNLMNDYRYLCNYYSLREKNIADTLGGPSCTLVSFRKTTGIWNRRVGGQEWKSSFRTWWWHFLTRRQVLSFLIFRETVGILEPLLLALWHWARPLCTQCLSFSICEMEIIEIPIS